MIKILSKKSTGGLDNGSKNQSSNETLTARATTTTTTPHKPHAGSSSPRGFPILTIVVILVETVRLLSFSTYRLDSRIISGLYDTVSSDGPLSSSSFSESSSASSSLSPITLHDLQAPDGTPFLAPCQSALQDTETNKKVLRNIQHQLATIKLPFDDFLPHFPSSPSSTLSLSSSPNHHHRNTSNTQSSNNKNTTNTSLSLPSSFQLTVHTREDDTAVSPRTMEWGCFDCGLWIRTLTALKEHYDEDPILLDIGSNIGVWGLAANLLMGIETYSFEPFRKNWIRQCQTIASSNYHTVSRYHLIQKALSKSGPQTISYRMSGHFLNPSALQIELQDPKSRGGGGGDTTTSATTTTTNLTEGLDYGWAVTLDSMAAALPTDRPVVIKMDVEQHECFVFEGAMKYLSSVRIVHVVIEVRSQQLREKCPNLYDIFALMDKNHLKPFMLLDNNNEGVPGIPLDYTNVTAWMETKTDGEFNVEWKS